MARFAIAYATNAGRTRRVVDRVADTLRRSGHLVNVHDAGERNVARAIARADGVVLAGSVHGGRMQPRLVGLAAAHGVALSERPGALVLVSLSAASPDPRARAQVDAYLRTFLACTPWRPDVIESVAGAYDPTGLGPVRRALAARALRPLGVDPHRSVDATDWDALERFAAGLARWFPRVGVATLAPGRRTDARPATSEPNP